MRVECQVGTKAVRATLYRVWQAPSTEVLSLLDTQYIPCLRSNLNICWQDKVTNIEDLDRAGSISIEAMILKTQLRS